MDFQVEGTGGKSCAAGPNGEGDGAWPIFTGFLVDATVTPVFLAGFKTTPYVVPSGYDLVITRHIDIFGSIYINVGSTWTKFGINSYLSHNSMRRNPLFFAAGTQLVSSDDTIVVQGYLLDRNAGAAEGGGDGGDDAGGIACDTEGLIQPGPNGDICVQSAVVAYKNCAETCSEHGLTCNDDTMNWFANADNHTEDDEACATFCPGAPLFLGGADCSQAPYCAGWGCAYCGWGSTPSVTCSDSHDDVKICPCE